MKLVFSIVLQLGVNGYSTKTIRPGGVSDEDRSVLEGECCDLSQALKNALDIDDRFPGQKVQDILIETAINKVTANASFTFFPSDSTEESESTASVQDELYSATAPDLEEVKYTDYLELNNITNGDVYRYEQHKLLGGKSLEKFKADLQKTIDESEYSPVLKAANTKLLSQLIRIFRGEGDEWSGGDEEKKLLDFLNSDIVNGFLGNVVDKINVQLGLTGLSIDIGSPMENVGSAFCKVYKDVSAQNVTLADASTCSLMSLMQQELSCASKYYTPKVNCDQLPSFAEKDLGCPKFSQNANDAVDISIVDEGVLVSNEQGNVDRWLLNGVSKLYQYAKFNSMCGSRADEISFIPGWKTLGELKIDYSDIVAGGNKTVEVPLSVLLTRATEQPETCRFVILNRGTVAPSDWLLDFEMEQVPLRFSGETIGGVTKGYSYLAEESYKYFNTLIEKRIGEQGCERLEIVVAGHSMGGGIGKVQALFLGIHHREEATVQDVSVSVVGFGVPQIFDVAADNKLRNVAVVREWAVELDPITEITCEEFPRCKHGDGHGNYAKDTYAYIRDKTIWVQHRELAKLMSSLQNSDFGTISVDWLKGKPNLTDVHFPAPAMMYQLHTCAYTCWMNALYCYDPQMARNLCDLCSDI